MDDFQDIALLFFLLSIITFSFLAFIIFFWALPKHKIINANAIKLFSGYFLFFCIAFVGYIFITQNLDHPYAQLVANLSNLMMLTAAYFLLFGIQDRAGIPFSRKTLIILFTHGAAFFLIQQLFFKSPGVPGSFRITFIYLNLLAVHSASLYLSISKVKEKNIGHWFMTTTVSFHIVLMIGLPLALFLLQNVNIYLGLILLGQSAGFILMVISVLAIYLVDSIEQSTDTTE